MSHVQVNKLLKKKQPVFQVTSNDTCYAQLISRTRVGQFTRLEADFPDVFP